jgi:DNA gyrase subunit A
MERFGLDDIQAQAILDMQLKRCRGRAREARRENAELRKGSSITRLPPPRRDPRLAANELTVIRDRYG